MHRSVVTSFAVTLLVALALVVPAHAEVKPFEAQAFADAQAAGKSIVVHVHAPW